VFSPGVGHCFSIFLRVGFVVLLFDSFKGWMLFCCFVGFSKGWMLFCCFVGFSKGWMLFCCFVGFSKGWMLFCCFVGFSKGWMLFCCFVGFSKGWMLFFTWTLASLLVLQIEMEDIEFVQGLDRFGFFIGVVFIGWTVAFVLLSDGDIKL
jgi:hypothetical protein